MTVTVSWAVVKPVPGKSSSTQKTDRLGWKTTLLNICKLQHTRTGKLADRKIVKISDLDKKQEIICPKFVVIPHQNMTGALYVIKTCVEFPPHGPWLRRNHFTTCLSELKQDLSKVLLSGKCENMQCRHVAFI